MVHGSPPFYDKNLNYMFYKINNTEPQISRDKSEECTDLIRKLLEKDPKKRIGSHNDFEEILSHEFFDDIDIEELKMKKIKPRYKPEIKSTFK